MSERLPLTVAHYARFDPRKHIGGVESFARGLERVFEEVLFMTPETRNEELVRKRRIPVICDNQWVRDWSEDIPVVGFQHGVAAIEFWVTPTLSVARLAWAQRQAARRKKTLWVACANWIQRESGRLYGSHVDYVVYHPVDLERFDGRLEATEPLILHDGRVPHKGSQLYPKLRAAFPKWRFEALACRL